MPREEKPFMFNKQRFYIILSFVFSVGSGWSQVSSRDFTIYYTDSTGNPGSSFVRHMVRSEKSDGSFGESSSDKSPFLRLVHLRPEFQVIQVADHLKMKSTKDYSASAKQHGLWPRATRELPENCTPPARVRRRVENLGIERVLEVSTEHYKIYVSNTDGTRTETESWFATSLGCHPVRVLERQMDASGKLLNTFEKKPERILIGQIEQWLLTAPIAYAEVSPSTLEKSHMKSEAIRRNDLARAENFPFPQAALDRMKRQDEEYQALRDGKYTIPGFTKK
jgi:hypothetical protein